MGELGGIGSCSCSCSCAGMFNNTGAILVLFILLVIISRAFVY
ncbi:MAG TPA: YjcZ family sporulation protein [Paenibacillus sp.]